MRDVSRDPGRRWWPRVLSFVIGLAMLALVAWAVIGQPIVHETPDRPTHLLLTRHDEIGQHVARWLERRPDLQLLAVRPQPEPLDRHGAWPPVLEVMRGQLEGNGVSADRLQVAPGQACDEWTTAEGLVDWLQRHPDARVAVLIDMFRSGDMRAAINAQAPTDATSRAAVVGLPSAWLDGQTWWQRRDGWKALLIAWLKYTFTRVHGGSERPGETWDPNRYEETPRRLKRDRLG